jgi:phospholipid transport system substrate-binding protein
MKLIRALVAAALVGFAAVGVYAAPLAPVAAVERLHAALLGAMQQATHLGYQGRYDSLKPVLEATFDLPAMAEIAAGPPWRNLSDEQRKQFLDVFRRFTYATYAYRFDGYDGETFETLGEQTGRNNTVLVNTRLVRKKDEPVSLNYLFHQAADGLRVVDVFMKGAFSELATRRSEYAAVIQREGFPSLIEKLEQKIADYAQGKKN